MGRAQTEKSKKYQEVAWDRFWERVSFEAYIEKETFHDRVLHGRLKQLVELSMKGKASCRFLETGGAFSKVLYRLSKEELPGLELYGLDNSVRAALDTGIKLSKNKIRIVIGDVFKSPIKAGTLQGVASFGLIEHFAEPAEYLIRCREMLAPGGRLVVGYPIYCGLTGCLQRWFNPSAFEYHYSLPAAEMAEIIAGLGFSEVNADYFGPFNPNMIDWGEKKIARLAMYGFFAAIRPTEWLCRLTGLSISSRWFSSYVIAAGEKPG